MTESLVKLNCYEPAGMQLEFSKDDLCGHSLAIGGTGSGKTTRFILPMIRELVRSRDIGLVILDTKADGSISKVVRECAALVGREEDLLVIDGGGELTIDIFRNSKTFGLTDVSTMTAMLSSLIPGDLRNRYWEETYGALLQQTLRLMILTKNPKIDYLSLIDHLIRYLLLHQLQDPQFKGIVDDLKEDRSHQEPVTRRIYDEVISAHRMWDTLDMRTRSNLQSMTTSLTGPMNDPLTHNYFSGTTPVCLSEVVDQSKILLVSIDGIRHAKAAKIVSRIVKGRFYEAILNRKSSDSWPLAGLILDDWPVGITSGWGNLFSDVEALSMIRSRGGFLVSSTQSLSVLDSIIGITDRKAAIANFANLLFFRGRDEEVDAMASNYFGEQKDYLIDTSRHATGRSSSKVNDTIRHEREIRRPAVPIGAIARLATGEAYGLIGPKVYKEPLCLVPYF